MINMINIIYKTIQQITSSLGDPEKESFKKVVLIEYPRKNLWTLAMVTGESKDRDSNEYYNIFKWYKDSVAKFKTTFIQRVKSFDPEKHMV